MPESNDAKRLHDLATELLKSGDITSAVPKLASEITDDFALAVTISADYLDRLAAIEASRTSHD